MCQLFLTWRFTAIIVLGRLTEQPHNLIARTVMKICQMNSYSTVP